MDIDNKGKKSRLEEFIEDPKKALWKLSLPMMFGMSVQAIYMMADTAFLGRMIGGTALASLGYVFPYFFILMGITFGLGSGATTVIAQFIGAKDKKNADNAAQNTIFIGIIIGIVIITIGFYYGDSLLALQRADSETIDMALDYFYVMAGGSIFMVLSVFFRSILSGEGEMMFPMIVMGIGTLLNIILDPILIYYYKIAGAALATIISQALVTLVLIYFLLFRQRSYVTFNFRDFKYNFDIIRDIFRLGMPASLSMIIMSMGVMLFNIILGSSYAVAAYQTAGRIEHFFFLPIIIALSFSLLFFFGISKIIPVFTSDQKIIELTITYFKIMSFAYPFITVGMTSSRIMQGLGHANPMLILTLFRVVIIAASLAWFFVIILGKPVHYAWVGTLISCILTSFISISWLRIIIRSCKPALETG